MAFSWHGGYYSSIGQDDVWNDECPKLRKESGAGLMVNR